MAASAYAQRSPAAKAKVPDRDPAAVSARLPASVLDRQPVPVRRELARPGNQLDAATRSLMERRFGHDLSQVRVHSDPGAAESARMLGARAYTVGEQVVFGAGRFAPNTPDGRRLLAHELAHVVQQRQGGGVGPSPTRHAVLEGAAHAAAHVVECETGPVAVTGEAGIGLAMAEETDGVPTSADPADVAAYARLRELQEGADHRAFELMAGVAQKLSRKGAGGPSAPVPGARPAGLPVTAGSAKQEAALIPGWTRKELTVAVGYAVDDEGHLHQLVTTNKSKRHKLVDLGPDEQWVKAVRRKKPPSAAGAAPLASPVHTTAAQHQSGDVGGGPQPQRKRTAQQSIQDAEARLAAHAAANKLRLIAVGASNNICPHCAAKLGLAGATAASPLAEDPLSEHVPVNISGALEAVRKLPAKQPTPPPVIERRWPGRGGGPGSPAGPGGMPGPYDPLPTPTKAGTPSAAATAPATATRSAGPARPPVGRAAEPGNAKAPPLAVDDDADTQVIQLTQAKRSEMRPSVTPSAGASGGQPTPVAAAPPKVTTETSGDLEKVTRKRVVDESTATARKVTATSTKVGWGEVSAETERLRTSNGVGTRTVTGGTVKRGEGNLTVTGRRDVSKGVHDQEGKLLSGTQTSYTAGGGLIAGPEGFGALGSAAAQQTTAYGKGFSTTKLVGGNARVVVKATQVEGADPPRYQLVVVVTIGASGTVGARGGERAAATASLSASGSVTGTFVHTFTAEQTRRYLGELGRNGVGGAEHELRVIDLVARGSVADARQLLAAYAAPLSAGDAAQLPEGDQASLELQGGAGGSLGATSAGKAPVSVEVSFSKGKSLKRTVARKDGAVLVTVEVVAETSGSLGASGSSGYVGGGISYGRKASAGESVTFRLDPREPSYQALFERIQAVDSATDLTALATSDSGHVVGAGSSTGWATTLTPKANLFGAEVAITTSHAYTESVNIDAAGRRRQFTGSSGGGVEVGVASGPKLGYHTEQTVTAAVGPDRRMSGDVSTNYVRDGLRRLGESPCLGGGQDSHRRRTQAGDGRHKPAAVAYRGGRNAALR